MSKTYFIPKADPLEPFFDLEMINPKVQADVNDLLKASGHVIKHVDFSKVLEDALGPLLDGQLVEQPSAFEEMQRDFLGH